MGTRGNLLYPFSCPQIAAVFRPCGIPRNDILLFTAAYSQFNMSSAEFTFQIPSTINYGLSAINHKLPTYTHSPHNGLLYF